MADERFLEYKVTKTLLFKRAIHGLIQYGFFALLGVILIPTLTYLLGKEGTGIFYLIFTTRSLLLPLVTLNLRSGSVALILHITDKSEIRKQYYLSFFFALLTTILFSCILLGINEIVSFKFANYIGIILLLLFFSIVQDFGTLLPSAFQKTFFLMSYLCTVEFVAVILGVFLGWRGWGPKGMAAGWIIAYFAGSIFIHSYIVKKVGFTFTFDLKTLKKYILFSMPLIPEMFCQWVLKGADKYILLLYRGMGEVGIYSVAYMCAEPTLFVRAMLNFFWYSTIIKLHKTDLETFSRTVNEGVKWVLIIITTVVLLFYIFAETIIKILTPEQNFAGASAVIPIIALSYGIFTIGQMFNGMILIKGKTLWIMIAFTLASMTNVGLNFLIIPHFGYYGAAWTTFLSYAVSTGILIGMVLKLFDIKMNPFNCIKIISCGALVSVLFAIVKMYVAMNWYILMLITFVSLGLYFGLLLRTNCFEVHEARELFNHALKIFKTEEQKT